MAKKLLYPKKPEKFLLAGFFIGLLILGGFFIIFQGQRAPLDSGSLEKILPTPAPYPQNSTGQAPPDLSAKSVVVMDVDSGVTLFEAGSDVTTLPASTTKIMTALVALENYRLDQVLDVGEMEKVEGQRMKLLPGEKITLENLLYGLLVASANDAALVLAKNFPHGETGFVWAMNQKAKELNLASTHFTNPVGFDEEGHYSTASDLTRLAISAMKNQEFFKIVGTEKITVFDVEGKISHQLTNVNTLIGKLPGVKGIKTGWTQLAGECLITFVEQDGRKIVLVVLGSKDRFRETEDLINWVFGNFSWESFNLQF